MPSRVLETVLTGRNLLSPVLAAAGRDVEAFNAAVAEANAEAGSAAGESAAAQETAAAKVVEANTRVAESASTTAVEQSAAADRAAASAAAGAEMQSVASAKVAEGNARARESTLLFAETTESSALRAGMAWQKLATIGLPLAGAAVAAVGLKMAADFQSATTRLETTAGESAGNLHMVGQGILDMAGQVGIGAEELAGAMYTVDSAGIHGADSLVVLRAAAQGAKQENADLAHVTDAVTTALHDFHLPASQAANVTSQLIAAVSHGKTTFDDLTGAMHSITPKAAAAGMNLAQVAGALAAMTASGMHADQAAQNLASTIVSFARGASGPMRSELSALGLSADDLQQHLGERGIAGTLQLISDTIVQKMGPAGLVALHALNQNKTAINDLQVMIQAMPPDLAKLSSGLLDGSVNILQYTKDAKGLGGTAGAMATQFLGLYKSQDGFNGILKAGGPAVQTYLGALAKAVGTQEGLSVALQLTGENAAGANAAIAAVGKASGDAQGNIEGWDAVQKTFNQRLAEAKSATGAFVTEIGQRLLPVGTQFLTFVAEHGVPALQDLGHGLSDLAHSDAATATLHGLADAGHLVGDGLHAAAVTLGPLLSLAGTAAHVFGMIPGPIQAVILALVGLKAISALGLFSGLTAGTTAAETSLGRLGQRTVAFGQTYRLQMALAGEETDALAAQAGALAAAFEASMPRASAAVVGMAASTKLAMAEVSTAFTQAKLAQQAAVADQFGAAAVGRATGDLAGLGSAAATAATKGLGVLKSAGAGVMAMFGGPWGLAIIGATAGIWAITNAYAEQQKKIADATAQLLQWRQAQDQGGQAAVDATKHLDDTQRAYDQAKTKLALLIKTQGDMVHDGPGVSGAIDEQRQKLKDLGKELGDSQRQYQKTKDSMSPVEWATQLVTKATNDFNLTLAQNPPNSLAVTEAAQNLRDALAKQAAAQDAANAAQKTAIQQLQEKANKELAATSSSLAAQQAQLELTDAIGQYGDDVRAGNKSTSELKSEQLQLAQSAISAAQAAGQAAADQAKANKVTDTGTIAQLAMLDSLQKVADALGSHTPKAVQDQIDALKKSVGQTALATEAMDALRGAVFSVPDSKSIVVNAPTEDQRQRLAALGLTVTGIPGTKDVRVTADTAQAAAALAGFVGTYWSTTVHAQVQYSDSGIDVGGKINMLGPHAKALGGIVTPFAAGGISPMPGGIADVVHPQTYRLIGDRVTDDEFYIPDNSDARSLAIGAEYVRRHPEVVGAALGAGQVGYNAAGTGFTAAPAAMPGYGPAASGPGIDYDRLAAALARAIPAQRGGPLVSIGAYHETPAGPRDLAHELAYQARTRGW